MAVTWTSVECYDSNKGSWTVVGNMPAKVEGAACCAVHLTGKTIFKSVTVKMWEINFNTIMAFYKECY